ncbi:Aste57867_14863 [Aphanomyces stellatus]|uniref:Aste57867_14863 protein n=1 Tax=Aphanomyces stellatus TaxID=120398 RepID=A0A485L1T5_9STRA|nr:hypothetical protein As57867_014807 [Aphanomyces stellatus]VFT91680.1 Aste57867_14863 [Aphanomyces stellatus]
MSQLNHALAAMAVDTDAAGAEHREGSPKMLKEDQVDILTRMLSLETPGLTAKMARYLNDDEHSAAFLSLITLVEPSLADDVHSFIRDGPSHAHVKGHKVPREDTVVTDDLMRSFRATMVLTGDDSSDAIISLLESKARLIVKCIFPIFQSNARGNLRHGCKLIDKLLRFHLDDVYHVIGVNSRTCGRYMQSMLEHIEHAPVADLFLTTICKPHNAALLRVYKCPAPTKIMFYRSLADVQIVLLLAQHVCDASYSEDHAIAAADVLLELLDRLAADDYGSIVLDPVGHSTQLLESLFTTALTPESKHNQAFLTPPSGRRTAAIRSLLGLLHKCALAEVAGPPTSPYQSFGSTVINMVPNQLAPAKAFVFARVQAHLPEILAYLQKQFHLQQASAAAGFGVKHTAYTVPHPFTEFRLLLVQVLVALVEQSPGAHLHAFSVDLWRVLAAWFVQYPHTNLYHHAFYRLVFLALRTNDAAILKPMLQQVKLVTTLVDLYRKDPEISSRGYILQCCNAIRLQAATLPPDAFLRSFLQSHATWRSFEHELRDTTCASVVKGLGIPVPTMMRMPMMGGPPSPAAAALLDDSVAAAPPGSEIDLGSEFAWKLGFVDDEEYEAPPGEHGGGGSSASKKKKKKNKGKKKVSMEGSADGSIDGDDDDEDTSDEMPKASGDDEGSSDVPKEKKKKRKKQKK